MKFMKSFYILWVMIGLIHSTIFAGPVYASKWKCGEQTILLYGDYHTTHQVDQSREDAVIIEFCKELEAVNQNVLVLCEDPIHPPCATVLSTKDRKALYPDWKKRFMLATSSFAYVLSKKADSYVHAQSVDPRIEYQLLKDAFEAFAFMCLGQEPNVLDKKILGLVFDGNIAGIFELPITNVKLFSEFTSNDDAREFFNIIAQTLEIRKSQFFQEIMANTGLSLEELNGVSIKAMIKNIIKRGDARYVKLGNIFSEHKALQKKMKSFSEVIDAEALWHIVESKHYYQKIVMIAGVEHVKNIEKYLFKLGFLNHICVDKEAQFSNDYITLKELYQKKAKICGLSVEDLIFEDIFLSAHSEKILWEAYNSYRENLEIMRTNSDISSEEYIDRLKELSELNREISEIFIKKQQEIEIVPFETFKWINEA